MHFASEALARGDLGVGTLYLKLLDRYQKLAAAVGYDDGDRERLLAKLNRAAERLGYDKKVPAEHEAAEHEADMQRFPAEQGVAQ